MAMDTVPLGACPANPTHAPRVPAGPNSLAACATRRGLLGAIAMLPALGVAMPALAAPTSATPQWAALVADFRSKHAIWLEIVPEDDQDMDRFREACAVLMPEPEKPDTGLPDDITHMTLAEIRATSETPSYKAAWAAYERDHAAWKERRAALREEICGPSKARYDASFDAYAAALGALAAHRVSNLHELGEKIEIVTTDYAGDPTPPEYIAEILADVRHLAGEARS